MVIFLNYNIEKITLIISILLVFFKANSIFGISEMILVVSNVFFHATSYFSIKELVKMENSELKLQRTNSKEKLISSYL